MWGLILRFSIYVLPWQLKQETSKGLPISVFSRCDATTKWEVPQGTGSSVSWTSWSWISSGLQPSEFHFPGSPQNYSRKQITWPCRNPGVTLPLTTASLSHLPQLCIIALFPGATLFGPTWPFPHTVITWLMYCFHLFCPMSASYVWPTHAT
jgi:hypothetical protein